MSFRDLDTRRVSSRESAISCLRRPEKAGGWTPEMRFWRDICDDYMDYMDGICTCEAYVKQGCITERSKGRVADLRLRRIDVIEFVMGSV